MKEIVLTGKKKGMAVLLGVIALYVLAILGVLAFCAQPWGARVVLLVLSIAVLALGWILLCGLKVLKPQEALVLTLFGKYIGTLKGEGFYYVNPFCTAVNPAAKTRLNQSGGCGRRQERHPGGPEAADQAASAAAQQEDLPEDHDPQQQPPEDQRLPGQPRGDRHRRHVAGGGHRQGGLQRGQLQGVPVPPVRQPPCGTSSASIPTTWPPTWTPPATAWPTRAASGAPARWWPAASRTRSRARWRRPAWRSSRPGSPTWPTRRRSPPSCSSASRPAPSSTPGR